MGMIYEDLTKTIGNTPLVRLNRLTEGLDATVTVAVKLESFNPLGSGELLPRPEDLGLLTAPSSLSQVKDSSGVSMIEAAERAGHIKEDSVIFEPFVVAGAGGTITCIAEVIKSRRPGFKAIAVEPAGSPVLS